MGLRIGTIVCVALALTPVGVGEAQPPTVDEQSSWSMGQAFEAILGGQAPNPQKQPEHLAVAMIFGDPLIGGGQYLCSGTLVGPRVVLTAAHCFDPTPKGGPLTIAVFFGNGFDINGKPIGGFAWPPVQTAYTHWSYMPGVPSNLYDVGVVILKDPMRGVVPVSPSAVPLPVPLPPPYQLDVFGFGKQQNCGAGQKCVLPGVAPEGFMDPAHIAFFYGPVVAPADSGGPTFVKGNGSIAVVGVHHGHFYDGNGARHSFDTHVPMIMDWLSQVLNNPNRRPTR